MRTIIAAFGVCVFALCAGQPAAARDFDAYASLGYSDLQGDNLTNGAVTSRAGVRFWQYLGIEGEASFGINNDTFVYSPPCHGSVCPAGPVMLVTSRLRDAEAIYAVAFLPISDDADLFVRGGYGAVHYTTRGVPDFTQTSFNFGAGGDYFLDGHNGVRLDYTRFDDDNAHNAVAREALGSGTNVWSAAYIFRF